MGKNGRKKKEKRKDFQKVKLKVGKKKPQAENFTNTTFKSQAIHLREQLKSGSVGDEPTTQRKQSIHDLVCHLNHYNGSIRQSSITGMKELLSSHPALMSQHLPLLIDSLSVLMTDKEDAVRRAGISLLQLVLQSTPNDSIAPFFPILSAHLSCAMTHIMEDIQIDSLAVLDLVLQFYPRLLTAQSRQLLTIFVEQISQQKKKTFGWAESDGESENKLTIKPGSKISSHKWRQKVLMRLKQFLTALLEQHYTTHSHYHGNKTTESTVIVTSGQETYAQIFAPCTRVHMDQDEFILRAPPSSSSSATAADDFTKPENLLGFIHSLVPLLLQCWMEVSPKSHQQAECHLNVVAIEILDGVLAVIQLLWRWMLSICEQKQEFSCMLQLQKLYQKKFINHLLACFPYTSHNALVQAKKSGKAGASVSMVNLNLAACEIMSYFMNKSSIENAWLRKIMVYVLETSLERNELSIENMQSLLSVVKRLVKALPRKESVKDLLQAVFTLYEKCHLLSRNKCESLICLDELTFHENTASMSESVGQDLLQSLPKLLLELRDQRIETSQHALEILLKRASRNHPEASLCVRNNISQFVDPDSGIFLLFPEHLQLAVIHLIHHADPLDLVTLRSLAKCCHGNIISARNVGYLINILSTSFLDVSVCNGSRRDLPFRLSDFISFLCSVSIGCSQADLKSLLEKTCQGSEGTERDLPESMTPIRLISQDVNERQRHLTIVKSVCLGYSLISSKQQMFDVVLAVFADLMNHNCTIPYKTAHAILYTTNYLTTSGTNWDQETVKKLTDCCLATMYIAAAGHAGSYKDGGWLEVMWTETVNLLVKSEEIFVAVMERIHSTSKDLCDRNHIQGVAMVLIRLLQTQKMASVFVQMSDCVNKAVQSILVHHLATDDTRWVTELRYEASVVLKAGIINQR